MPQIPTAKELREKYLLGETTAVAIVTSYLEQIERCDPSIQAFLSVFKDEAMQQAAALDQKRARNEPLGKLAGVVVGIKDNIHVKGHTTTCGSKILEHFVAPFDATATERLKKEDAILIGKLNLDEFAMGSSTENSAYQITKNPWNLNCTPGGSSGGSAAAVAGGLCPIALGSDTGGSIRQPGSFCGVVGYKPTYGLVSRYGLVAYGSSLDVIGPLATNVYDAALVSEVISGHCKNDATSIPQSSYSYLERIDQPLNTLTIGVPWHFLEQLQEEPKALFHEGVARLEKQGAKVVEIDLDILRYSLAVYYILATAEASTNLARFDGVRYGLRSKEADTLEKVYDLSKDEGFGDEVKRRILMGTFVLSSGHKNDFYKKAQKVRTLMIRKYKEAFQHCDVIATPVSPFGAFPLGSIQDPVQMYLEDIYTIGTNLAGLPGISVPSSFTSKQMPMGMQFTAPHKQDPFLLQVAHYFEQLTDLKPKMPEWIHGK